MRRILAMSFVGVLALVGVACDDDDNGGSSSGNGGGGDAERFCDLNEELIGEEPSDEQLDELADTAPSEIRGDVDPVVEFFKEEGTDAELPDDLQDESDNVGQWIQDNCDGDEEPTETT